MSTLKEQNANLLTAKILVPIKADKLMLFSELSTLPAEMQEALQERCDVSKIIEDNIYLAETDPDSLFSLFSNYIDELFGKIQRKYHDERPVLYFVHGVNEDNGDGIINITGFFALSKKKPQVFQAMLGAGNQINEVCVRLRWGKASGEVNCCFPQKIVPGRHVPKEMYFGAVQEMRALLEELRKPVSPASITPPKS